MIVYDTCKHNGWRISSSTTESECGAVPARVKGPGKRWDADHPSPDGLALDLGFES